MIKNQSICGTLHSSSEVSTKKHKELFCFSFRPSMFKYHAKFKLYAFLKINVLY